MNVPSLTKAALVGAGLALLAACGGRPSPTPALVERALEATVAIEAARSATVAVVANPQTGALELAAGPEATADYGAGVALDDGYILTSGHLVDGAARVQVRLAGADGPPMAATVVGVSMCDDLALLQVSGDGPRPARLGSSAELQLGAPVVAMGFAPGGALASPTASAGIVSWLAPSPGGRAAGSLFTTSAPLLPGGTGGPLLGASGKVVGIMAEGRFAAPAGGADYVIGIDYGRSVAEELRERGSILSLGLDLVELADDQASAPYWRYFGPEGAAGGLFVRSVAPEAVTAGVQPGDLLIGAAGRPVSSLADLCGALGDPNLGLPADLEVLRRSGEAVERVRASLIGVAAAAPPAERSAPRESAAEPQQPTAEPAPVLGAAPVAVLDPSPAELQAAREALGALRAQHSELFFETFDNDATKARWRPADEAAVTRELIYSYYRIILKQPGAVTTDSWGDRALGASYIVEVDTALPPTGTAAVGIVYDQQTDGSGLSYFVVGADGSWQHATVQGGAPVPGRYARGASPAFVVNGGTNQLRVVRTPAGAQLWLNDTLVGRAEPGPFGGGHAGVIALAGPEPLPQPVTVIVDNFRLLEQP